MASRRLAVLLFVGLFAFVSSATAESTRIPVRIVEGRLVLFCDISTPVRRIPANFFVELETPCGLRLHNRAATALRTEDGAGKPTAMLLHLPGMELEVATREHGNEDDWEKFTRYHSKELGENALVGVIGAQLLEPFHVTLDLAAGFLYLDPPHERNPTPPLPSEKETIVPITLTNDLVWLPIRYPDNSPAAAVLTTGHEDSFIDVPVAERFHYPQEDLPPIRVAEIDLTKGIAFRPDTVIQDHPDGVFGSIGLNLLLNFRVEIDRVNRLATLRQSRPVEFPHADLAYFRATATDEAEPLSRFLEKYPTSRLAHEAARLLLDLQIDEGVAVEAIESTLRILNDTYVEDLRATAAFDLMKELSESGYDAAVIPAGEIGIESGRKDRYPNSVHEIHSKMGQILHQQGDDKEAWRHLLSAAFGIPEDGLVNLYLGLHYERQERYKRAFSRFVQAVIKPESGERAFAGLERVQKQISGDDRMSVDVVERMISGKVMSFGAATKFKPTDENSSNRVVLCEFFTNAHLKPALAGALGNEGLVSHFPRDKVAMVSWHLPQPKLEPLTNSMAMTRTRESRISQVCHLINGVVQGPGAARKDQREELYDAVRKQILDELKKPSDFTLDLTAHRSGDLIEGEVTVTGPKRFGRVIYVVLVEKGVLFPGDNEVVIHRNVGRGSMIDNEEGELFTPNRDGSMTLHFSRLLTEITAQNEAFLDATMAAGGGSTTKMSTHIDPEQTSVIAFVRDITNNEVLQAAQVDTLAEE